MRARRAEQDRRRSALGVQVVTALAERDAVSAVYETRAGRALATLTDQEGLSLAEAVQWCGAESLSMREAARLRQTSRPVASPTVSESAPATGAGRGAAE